MSHYQNSIYHFHDLEYLLCWIYGISESFFLFACFFGRNYFQDLHKLRKCLHTWICTISIPWFCPCIWWNKSLWPSFELQWILFSSNCQPLLDSHPRTLSRPDFWDEPFPWKMYETSVFSLGDGRLRTLVTESHADNVFSCPWLFMDISIICGVVRNSECSSLPSPAPDWQLC